MVKIAGWMETIAKICAEKRQDGVYAKFGSNAIKVPDGKVQRMTGDYIGKEVYMGIRPENISDDPVFTSTYPDACIDVDVEIIELMGSETYLYMTTSGKDENFIARVERQSPPLLRCGNREDHPVPRLISVRLYSHRPFLTGKGRYCQAGPTNAGA